MTFYTIRSGATAMSESVFLALLTDLVINSGIVDITGTQFQVTGSGSNMSVNVAAGRAYLLASGGNAYPLISDAVANIAINTNSSGNPRITSIVAYDNLGATANSGATNVGGVIAVDGTPASSPSAPSAATIQSAVGAGNPYTVIATVLVNSGVSVINTSNVTDVRTQVTFKFSQGSDGWTSVSDTFIYNSATSVKIIGVDRTAIYTKGTRVKFTNNGSVYYGTVISSTFSTDTTINFAPNADYAINNSAITFPAYSYQASPQGYPTWFNFATTWSGFSSNPTGNSGNIRFRIDGAMCTVDSNPPGVGTSNTSSLTFTVPVNVNAIGSGNFFAAGVSYNSGSYQQYAGSLYISNGTNTVFCYKDTNQSSNWTPSGTKGFFALFSYPI